MNEKYLRALMVSCAVCSLAIAANARADQTGNAPPSDQAKSESEPELVVVTGLRGSLQRDLNIKRGASGVLDSISSEDIGKFPDANVADALQRLPGLSIQRSGARGDATGVTVRGFGGDFNETLYDGRRLSTASGGRGVDFTTVGSDFVGRLSVYKTPDVELGVSSIGATIDIALPKPLDRPGFHLVGTVSASNQDRNGDYKPSGGFLVSDTFHGGKMGLLFDVAYTRHDSTSNQVTIPGWIGNRFYQCQLTAACTANDLVAGKKTALGWFPQQLMNYQVATQDERLDTRIAYQWQISDNLLLTLDNNYSNQTVHTNNYGAGAWFNGDDLRGIKLDSNGTVTDFNQFGSPMDFINANIRNINRTNQFGANLKWQASEHLSFDFDAAVSKSELNPGRNGYADNMDIGYGGSNADPNGTFVSTPCSVVNGQNVCTKYSTTLGANTGVVISGDSSDHLPSFRNIGPAGNLGQFTNQAFIGSHVITRNPSYISDSIKQFRATGKWEADNVKIHFGARYSQDEFHQESQSTFVNGTFTRYAGYGAPSGRTGGIAPLPASVYTGSIGTGGFIPGYDGNVVPSLPVFDVHKIYSLLEATGGGTTNPALDPSSVQDIKETTWAGFFKLSLETDIASMPFHISAGLRDEYTSLDAAAIGTNPVTLVTVPTDPTLINVGTYTPQQTISKTSSYNYLLPSFDAKLDVTSDIVLRIDASRTLTRPPLNYLKPTIALGTLRKGSLSASGGNPNLKPYLSDNFDVGAEWYYARNSYLSVALFQKYITNFIVGGVTTQTINGVVDPSTGQTAQFQVNSMTNGPDGTVKGAEIALQHVFGDTGWGFDANATLVSTNRDFNESDISGSAFAITGLANSANFVGFYDKKGFQARIAVNWRDHYTVQLGQSQGGTFGAEPVNVNSQLQLDASTSWDVNKRVTVFLEGTNLNDSTYSTYGRWANQPLDIWSYGRRITFGVRYHY